MANDRIRLVCKGCGASKMLMKYYPGGAFVPDDTLPELNEWLNEHLLECHPFPCDVNMHGNPGFLLETESQAGCDAEA